ncbi:hypothetical protein MHYP_G00228030 [Metynnis hypsauchen]
MITGSVWLNAGSSLTSGHDQHHGDIDGWPGRAVTRQGGGPSFSPCTCFGCQTGRGRRRAGKAREALSTPSGRDHANPCKYFFFFFFETSSFTSTLLGSRVTPAISHSWVDYT